MLIKLPGFKLKNSHKKILKSFLVFLLVSSWLLTGYPAISVPGFGIFPPKIEESRAVAPILNTLLPTAYSSQTGTAWTTTTVGNIDEGIAGADGLFIVAGVNSTSSIFYDITDTPSDFVKMINFNYDIRYKITPLSNDTETLYVQVFKSDKATALTDEMLVVSTTTALTIRNKGSTAFTGVSTTATKADWDGAYFRIRTTHSAAGGKDNSIWSIDGFEMTGTYNAPPTVILNTPTNGQTVSDNPPTLNFTGTDLNSDDIKYNVQVDSVNTFDSQTTIIASYDESNYDSDVGSYYGTPGMGQIGQTFLVGGSDIYLTSIKLYLKKSGSPAGPFTISLYATSGGLPTGASLTTIGSITSGSLTTSSQLLEYTLATPYLLSANTTYAIVILASSGTSDNANYLAVGRDASSPGYTDGTAMIDPSGSWLTSSADWIFYIYSKTPLTSVVSGTDMGFSGSPDNSDPFASGQAVTYAIQSSLSAGTYYWRVRGIDPLGGNTYGSWSDTFSFTISTQTTFTQNKYRWYYDNDLTNPVTAWGMSALAENTSIGIIPSGKDPPDTIQELRLRVNLVVNGLILPASSKYFKLEYKAGTDGSCTTGTWTDVGTGTWTYATSGVTDGSNITASLSDTTSGKGEQYAKSKPTVLNSAGASVGEIIEYDFHIIGGTATPNTTYSFRMVGTDSGGTGETVLDAYTNCPTLTTEPGTADLMRHGQVFTNSIKQGFFWTN